MHKNITVIDQTIREGMQYRGLMFDFKERKKIVEFQETLGVDICQAAYAPAHESEARHLKGLHEWSRENGRRIRIAGLCRAIPEDVKWMLDVGIRDFHLHSGISREMLARFGMDEIFKSLRQTVHLIRGKAANYADAKNLNDFKLLQTGWVYDVNFIPTFQRIFKQGYLTITRNALPQSAQIDELFRVTESYLKAQIQK